MTAAKASARKSLGEYKPLIVYPNGKTEVCEKSPERANHYTAKGMIKGNRYARGKTYADRAEAIAAAQDVIDYRREATEAEYRKWAQSDNEKVRASAHRKLAEARLWGSKLS